MKLLLHTCCAPCSVYCIESLREEGIEPIIYWYNPNIHPYTEYKERRNTLKKYAEMIECKAIFEEDYGLKEFCKNVIKDLEHRCSDYCYKIRLEQTAKYAKENGYTAFTTTLLISPYQNHNELIRIGQEMAKKYNIELWYGWISRRGCWPKRCWGIGLRWNFWPRINIPTVGKSQAG